MKNNFFYIFYIFLAYSLLLSNKGSIPEYDHILEQATEYYFNGEYEKAYEYSIKGLEFSPNHPYLNFYIGDYYGFQGNPKEALKYFDIAIANHTHDIFPTALYQRGIAKMLVNKDLSFCDDIKIVKKSFESDDTYAHMEENNPQIFLICSYSEGMFPHELIDTANLLAEENYCAYSYLFYNEASKNGTWKELSKYDNSKCPIKK